MAFPAYLALSGPLTLTRILRANGGFDARYAGRVAALYAVSWVALPFDALESAIHGARIARQKLSERPLVILGHDRSGTTHLLNLLALDPQFAYTRPSQMVLPGSCVLFDRAFDALLERIDYRRPFDDMEVGPGSPQDDEVPLVKLTPHCEYHKYSFPRSHRRWLERYVFGFSPSSPEYAAWKRAYLGTLRKAAYLMKRERSLLKSPAWMANLGPLLDLFPDARFVHIRRHPHKVIPSQIHLHRTMARKYGLEAIDDAGLVDFAIHQYRGYTEAFARDKERIPSANLLEIRYEDFVGDRIGGLREIYARLGLGDFAALEPRVTDYLRGIERYEGHRFPDDPALRARIDRDLAFAFPILGYPTPT